MLFKFYRTAINKYIRTMENQRGFHRLQNNLNLKLTPFGENLQVNISTYLNRYISEGNNYTHTYSDFGVNGSVTFLKGNWFLMASASKGHKILWGETSTQQMQFLIKRAEAPHAWCGR